MTQHKDALGKTLEPGQFIMYAAADGRSAVLRAGRIISIGQTRYNEPSIRAAAVYFGYNHLPMRLKDVSLHFPNRIVVVQAQQISAEVLGLLED